MTFPFLAPVEGVGLVAIPVLGITTNVYVLGRPGEALIIDCGAADTAGEVIATLEARGFRPGGVRAIVITHGHADHYGGAGALSKWSGAPVWAHLHAAAQIEDLWGYFVSPVAWMPNATAADWDEFRVTAGEPLRVGRILREGDAIEAAGMHLEVLHAPGHDRGEIVLFERARKLAFVGDLIQGGADASKNWLGLYTDPASQRRSLARVAELAPAWLFRGHRAPRAGADVAADLAAAAGRLEAIERALLDALRARAPRSLAELTRAAMKQVLGGEKVSDTFCAQYPEGPSRQKVSDTFSPANYAAVSVQACLLDLARRGLVRRTADLEWEPVGGAPALAPGGPAD